MNNIEKNREAALEKGALCKRLSRTEALSLVSCSNPSDILRLGNAALKNRLLRYGNSATYIENLVVNPSNICEGKCGFCHYWAEKNDSKAYIMDEESILKKIEHAQPQEIHLVGGLNEFWHFHRYLSLLRAIRNRWPSIHLKTFTAVEINYFAEMEHTSPKEILQNLKDVSVQGLTGGGAEIFSERMRTTYCPDKLSPEKWLFIHKTAHKIGFTTNATMLYGLGETSEEIVDHLFLLRSLQDETGGFSCFIPLAYQPARDNESESGPTTYTNLKMIALARLILDNVKHIKAYWPMIGLETAAVGLSWGADDLDGTLGQENIAHAGRANSPLKTTKEIMEETIYAGGFIPHARDGLFSPIERKD